MDEFVAHFTPHQQSYINHRGFPIYFHRVKTARSIDVFGLAGLCDTST